MHIRAIAGRDTGCMPGRQHLDPFIDAWDAHKGTTMVRMCSFHCNIGLLNLII